MHSSLPPFFTKLTLDDLAAWAGETVFQRGVAEYGQKYDRNDLTQQALSGKSINTE